MLKTGLQKPFSSRSFLLASFSLELCSKPLLKRRDVKLLEGLGEFADVFWGKPLHKRDLVTRYLGLAEHRAQVGEQLAAVLEVDKRPVKDPVERSAPHGSTTRIAGAASAVARVDEPHGAAPYERAGAGRPVQQPAAAERLVRRGGGGS